MEVTESLPDVHPNLDVEMGGTPTLSSFARSLQDNYCDTPFKFQGPSHRVLRKRPLQTIVVSCPKRRFSLKPKKVTASASNKNLENFYLGNKFKPTRKANLETIFEEPVTQKDGTVKYCGVAKLRRLNLDSIAKSKVKKRKMKVKKMFGGKRLKNKHMSLDEFIKNLRAISKKVDGEEIAALLTNCEIK